MNTMIEHPASLYAEIEQFCKENQFTVGYFLDEYAVNEQQIRKPFSKYRGRSVLSER